MLPKPRMILKLVVLLVLVTLVQPAIAFQIRPVGTDSGVILRLRGDVRVGDYRRLNTILQNRPVVGLEDLVRRRLLRRRPRHRAGRAREGARRVRG